ncbi:hypothetical protein CLOM_g20181, partial [Closterium sp. NIES-68]
MERDRSLPEHGIPPEPPTIDIAASLPTPNVVERTPSYTPRWVRGAAGGPLTPSAMASASAAATAAASASASAAAAAAAVSGPDPATPSGPMTGFSDLSSNFTNPPTPQGFHGFPGFQPRDPERDRRNLSMEMPEPPPRRRTRPRLPPSSPARTPPGLLRGAGETTRRAALRAVSRPGHGKVGHDWSVGLIGQSGMFPPPSVIPQSGSWGGTAPSTPSIPKSNLVQKSMIMCMDPTCNKCPPEMHALRNRKLMRRLIFEDDEEYDEETGGKRTIIRCCGLPCVVFTSRGKRRSPMLGFFRFVEGLVQPVGILNPHS